MTGGTGFVGSHTTARLLDHGHEPRLLVRDPDKAARVLGRLGIDLGRVELVTGDMLDLVAVDRLLAGADAAVHAAAAIGVTGPAGTVLEQNVAGTRNVVGQAVELGLDPVIYISTVAVFVPPDGPVITTESRLASPRTEYGRSKLAAERYVRQLQDEGAPVCTVYPGGVLGPDQPTLDAMMEGLVSALGAPTWPMSTGGVAMIDVRDLAEGLARMVRAGLGPRRLMLAGRYLTWPQLADLCDELTGVPCRRLKVPARVLTGLGSLLDGLKRVRPFDYALTRDAAEIMVTMVAADDSATLEALDLELRPVRDTLEEALRELAAAGHLAPAKAGRMAEPA